MNMKHVQENNYSYDLRKSRMRKQRAKRRLSMQIFFMLILFTAIAAYFCNYSFLRFIIILSVEIVAVSLLVLISVYIMFSNNKNKKIPNKKMQPVGQKYVVKRTSTRRLVKLERKNLNWSDEDIQRKQQDSLLPDSTAYETEKEEFSYRSPFEPINPPAKDYADDDIDEKDDIQDNINDEKKINDVNEEQKTQSPPRYKAKVIRKKKKKKAQDKNPTINT